MQVGRNDPCPCKSGKKFKKCCLNKDAETGDLLWRQLGSIHDDMANRLLEHGIRVFGKMAIEEAWDEFWSWENEISFSDAYESEQHKIQLFMPYFLYNWMPDEDTDTNTSPPKDTTIAADFLEKRGRNLTELERRFLTATLTVPFSFHDILEVEPGQGLVMRDIFLGTVVKVTERSGSKLARVGDIAFGKVIQIDHIGMICGMGWVIVPPVQKQLVLDLRKMIRDVCKKDGTEVTAETLQDYDIELRELFLEVEKIIMAPTKLCNTDGEEFSFHRITYTIDSPQTAFDKLKDLSLLMNEDELLDGAERASDGTLRKTEIDWHKHGNAIHSTWDNTIMGRFLIDDTALTIEVNSEGRAKRARKEVEKRLKGHATYKSTVIQSPESMMREHDTDDDPKEEVERERKHQELMNRPEVQEHLRKTMEAHWEKWFHEKIPALGNKTPLQAAKTADGREMLEALFVYYERNDAPTDQPCNPDYSQMRKRLGLLTAGHNLEQATGRQS